MGMGTARTFVRAFSIKSNACRFGKLMFRLRTEKGLSLGDIGKRVGCSRPYLCQVQNGVREPNDRMVYRMAKALQVDPDLFFSEMRRIPKELSDLDGYTMSPIEMIRMLRSMRKKKSKK
jgi:transcriptional regulator with XRE-family HTH domain